jgi:hypothetical protein
MINFDLIFEDVTPDQFGKAEALLQRWLRLDINAMAPEDLVREVKNFIDVYELKSLDDLSVAMNPNSGLISVEGAQLLNNMLTTLNQRWGKEKTEREIFSLMQ